MNHRVFTLIALLSLFSLLGSMAASAEGQSPEASLGQPGFSLRYVQTYGVVEQPYFDDPNHLNGPNGLGTDGTNLWITECPGARALKYGNDGAFQMQIGRAGFQELDQHRFGCLYDATVDGDGNLWVVDRGNQRLLKFDANGNQLAELGQIWTTGTDNNQFNNPYSIAIDPDGNLYVSDQENHRIQVFDNDANYLATLGQAGVPGSDNSHFNYPNHISVDSNRRLYVADGGNHRVQIFNASNPAAITYMATIGTSGVSGSDNAHFNQPEGVAVDVARSKIYVADAFNFRMQIFNYTTRAYQSTLLLNTYVVDTVVDSAGNLYVAEPWYGESRVLQFDSSLALIHTYGTTGVPYLTDNAHFNQPAGVAAAPDGSLYFGESDGRRLMKFSSDGVLQWTIGEPGVWGNDNFHFSYVEDVDLDPNNRVYALDRGHCRVQVYNQDGSYVATLGSGCGGGTEQFQQPWGLAVGPDGKIYVADTNNHRVQVFHSSRVYLATLGETGIPGADNSHFNGPFDVDVDAAGNIYVADTNNHRVQVFNSSRAYVRTIGITGESGDDFAHLPSPTTVTTDASGRTYVADLWGNRVQVFDSSGAYLTTIGGREGKNSGQMRNAQGLDVDTAGNLYVAEWINHRIQKFAPGVPKWVQSNLNGFGDTKNQGIRSLSPFAGRLYAGTSNDDGAKLWRLGPDGWALVMEKGFGDLSNYSLSHLMEFKGMLYAGTWNRNDSEAGSTGGQVWRSSNGTNWSQVTLSGLEPTQAEILRFAVFNDRLYAGTWSSTNEHGAEIWRSSTGNSGEWERVVNDGFNADLGNTAIVALETYNGFIYAGTGTAATGGEIWRSPTGNPGDWAQVNEDGFGSPNYPDVSALAVFEGYLYASTGNRSGFGVRVWRCQACDGTDWQLVVENGFGNTGTVITGALQTYKGKLYFIPGNTSSGMEVWRTANGTDWEQVGWGGFGDSNNICGYVGNSVAIYNDLLFIGTMNSAHGGEVWQKTLTADFTASQTAGLSPLAIQFTNLSAGDYTTSSWNFGDGKYSSETNPVHIYTTPGVYSVTLKVSGPLDQETEVKFAYIKVVGTSVYLPLIQR